VVEHFNQLGWLSVEKRVKLNQLCLIHKIITYSAPMYLSIFLKLILEMSTNTTPEPETLFLYTGTVEWNNLPQQLKAKPTITSFKKNVKS
jgi:hypothetical protein